MKKFLFTHELKKERPAVAPRPAIPGPSTSDEDSDLSYLGRFALAEELADLVKIVKARVGREPVWVYWKCSGCGYVTQIRFRDPNPGGVCPKCSRNPYIPGGGQLKQMTDGEVEEYLVGRKKAEAEFCARAERGALAYRNEERAKAGLELLSLEEFRAEKRAEFLQSRANFKKAVELHEEVDERNRKLAEERAAETREREAKERRELLGEDSK